MITRKPKAGTDVAKKVERVMDNHFDHGDGAFQRREAVVAANLAAIAATVKPAKAGAPGAKKAGAKPKPKQTKKPSQKKAESETKPAKKKPTPNKVKMGQKSPAARKPKPPGSGNKAQNARTPAGGRPRGGGGGGSAGNKAKVKQEPIKNRWAKMTKAARSSYIQSRAGKSVPTPDADKALAPIWNKLSGRQQAAHKRRHPQSRLKVQTKDSNPASKRNGGTPRAEPRASGPSGGGDPTPERRDLVNTEEDQGTPEDVDGGDQDAGPEDHRDHDWWDEQDAEFQQKYLADYPRSKFAMRHRSIVKNLVGRAKDRIVRSAKRTGTDYHQGMQGIKAWRSGAKMTEEQADGLKRTAAKVGAVLVLVCIGLTMLSPLGPVAMDFGEAWFKSRFGQSAMEGGDNKAEAGVNLEGHEKVDAKTKADHEDNNEQLAWMIKDMTKFMLAQRNPKAFAKKISTADKS